MTELFQKRLMKCLLLIGMILGVLSITVLLQAVQANYLRQEVNRLDDRVSYLEDKDTAIQDLINRINELMRSK